MMEPKEAARIMSRGLQRRIEMLSARSATPRAVVLVYPTGAPAVEIAAFEADLAERKRANPQQAFIVIDTGIGRSKHKEA